MKLDLGYTIGGKMSMILVFIYIRYMRIFAGVPRVGASKYRGVIDDDIFG